MADMMKPRVRTSAGDNKSVNSAAFGKIAHSAAVQQGDENQREWYNGIRGTQNTDQYDGGGKTSKAAAKLDPEWESTNGPHNRKAQRAGGKGK